MSTDKSIRWQTCVIRAASAVLEIIDEKNRSDDEQKFLNIFPGRDAISRRTQISTVKRGKFETIVQSIQTVLRKYYCIPPDIIRDVVLQNHPDFGIAWHNLLNEKYYNQTCKLFAQELNSYSLEDFDRMYIKKTPIFYAGAIYPFNYYHNLNDSVEYLHKLLLYQNDYNEELVFNFSTNLKLGFNKEVWGGNPKINAIAIIGPPNSDKNYFFDAIVSIVCNVSQIGRVN